MRVKDGIDTGCIAVVEALNALPGIKTIGSCEGHVGHFFVSFHAATFDALGGVARRLEDQQEYRSRGWGVEVNWSHGSMWFAIRGPAFGRGDLIAKALESVDPPMPLEGHTYSDGVSTWNVPDLWRAVEGLEPVQMPLGEIVDIEEFLDSHTWSCGPMSVREIVREADRLAGADLSWPIILTPEGHIADGCHRIMRALRDGVATLPVVRLAVMPPPACKPSS